MTFDEFWKHYVGGDKDKSLETGRIYAASAWDYQQARIEALEKSARALVKEIMSDDFSDEAMEVGKKLTLELSELLQEPTK